MTQAMQEIVLSFLTRMAFLFGEGHRDAEYQVSFYIAACEVATRAGVLSSCLDCAQLACQLARQS